MDVTVKHLICRNGKFYYRSRLPVQYSQGSKRELKLSLRTSDLKKAVPACKLISEKVQHLIEQGAFRMIPLQKIREILAEYITENLEGYARFLSNYGEITPQIREDGKKSMLCSIKYFEKALAENNLNAMSALAEADILLKDIPHNESDRKLMANEFLQAQLMLKRLEYERLTGKRFATEYSDTLRKEILEGSYRSAEEIREAETVHKLEKLICAYLSEPHPTWGTSMRDKVEQTLYLLVEFFSSEEDIRRIKMDNMLLFRDNVLRRLPARWKTMPGLRERPLREVIEDTGHEKLSLKTVNLRLDTISGFFRWCFDKNYVDRNPVSHLKIKLKEEPEERRTAYMPEDLVKLFGNLRRDKLHGWAPYKFWIPLIGLYSGARENEICQMQTTDIVLKDGIVCFSITKEGDERKRLKNPNSQRLIPLHPVLLDLGFLGYALSIKKERQTSDRRLWPQLTYNEKHGFADRFQKFFGHFNRRYVTTEKNKVFHSLRHCFCNSLKQGGISKEIAEALAGHKDESMTFGTYAKAYEPKVLKEAILKLNFELNIFEVLDVRPLPKETIRKQMDGFFQRK
ncbi:MAG: Phage integrase family protein [Lentisphaerae bacterium ADurb.Bin242]|nr:MAG: Phage integrase family protein [Lentisphaerae bacterium ADurb.Bin242]